MKTVILTLAIILGSSAVLAAEGTSTTNTEFHNTARAGKNWMIAGQVTGLTSKVGTETGGTAGFYLNPDSMLLLEVYGTEGSSFFNDMSSKTEIKSQNVALMYKKFLGNSFYIKGGAFGRSVNYTRAETPQDEKFQGNSYGASIGLGNQWQIANFTIGADWISFSQPMATTITSEQRATSSSGFHAELEDSEKTYLRDSYFQFARLYVGASF